MELRPGSHALIMGASRGLGHGVVKAVERGERPVYRPPSVRVLRSERGLSRRLAEVVLRRLHGFTAAPRR